MNGEDLPYSYPRVDPAHPAPGYNYQVTKTAKEEPIREEKQVARDLEALPPKKKLKQAMQGHIIAHAELMGTYQKKEQKQKK